MEQNELFKVIDVTDGTVIDHHLTWEEVHLYRGDDDNNITIMRQDANVADVLKRREHMITAMEAE